MVNQGYPETTTYMGIRLTVQSEDPQDPFYHPTDFFPLAKEGGVLIGRAASNDIQLSGVGVSNIHCRVEVHGHEYIVEDAGSSNGTFVGYRQLRAGERYSLKDGDVVRVVSYSVTFRMGLSAFSPQPETPNEDNLESTLQVEHAMVQQFLSEPEEHSPQITFLNGSNPGLVFTLQEYEDCTVGRDPNCALCLPEDAVSRQHALIRRDWSGVTLRDLNSANGVFVNGIRIQPNTEVSLNNGDQIGVGHYILGFSDPFAASLEDKLKGVWVEDDLDNTMSGATIIGGDRKKKEKKEGASKEPSDQDVREPVSGQWRAARSSADMDGEDKPKRRRRKKNQEEGSTPKPAAKHPSEISEESSSKKDEGEADKAEASPVEAKKKSRKERRAARRKKLEEEASGVKEAAKEEKGEEAKSSSKSSGKSKGEVKGDKKSGDSEKDAATAASTPELPGKSQMNSAEKVALIVVAALVFLLVVLVLVFLFLV